MDVSIINQLSSKSIYDNRAINHTQTIESNNETFEAMFESAMTMLNETNDLTNAASEEEMKYALGLSSNTHDLQAAQYKANISLQYTVAVRNSLIDAYKEIMNLQF